MPMSASTSEMPFQSIAPYLAVGSQPVFGWRSINTYPLVILVGVTGVGKSTLLNEMRSLAPPIYCCPTAVS